jgi:hypothetical protein
MPGKRHDHGGRATLPRPHPDRCSTRRPWPALCPNNRLAGRELRCRRLGHDAIGDARGSQRRRLDLLPRRHARAPSLPDGAPGTRSRRQTACSGCGPMSRQGEPGRACTGRHSVRASLLPSGTAQSEMALEIWKWRLPWTSSICSRPVGNDLQQPLGNEVSRHFQCPAFPPPTGDQPALQIAGRPMP